MPYRLALTLAAVLLFCGGCTSPAPAPLSTAIIQDCPNRPNCAITDNVISGLVATDVAGVNTPDSIAAKHKQQIAAPELIMPADQAWPLIVKTIAALPRTVIVEQSQFFLHAECKSRWFGFIDDLHIQLKADNSQLLIRSAARVGYADFGVNRQRIESIIAKLRSQRIVK